MPSPRQRTGSAVEARALEHLRAAGLHLLERNFQARAGELDLVMREGAEIVFVEVRARVRADYGGAAASVTPAKQQRVRRAAQLWLQRHHGSGSWPPFRFDVVAVEGERAELNWIRGAF
jgi:putative endonuclease